MAGVLLLPHYAPEADWLAARRHGIGASEIAAVMGISPYDSPFSLWWRKQMGWETDANPEMSTGTWLEPTIADWYEENADPNGNLAIRRAGLYANPDRPWQTATPDRLIYLACPACDGGPQQHDTGTCCPVQCRECLDSGIGSKLLALLECKWVAYSWDGWGEEGTDEVPVHYRAQALWQLDVMGVDEVTICALGPGGFRVYRIRRDETDLCGMRERGRRFMDSLAAGKAPDVDEHSATLPILRRLHADIEDREQEIPARIAEGWQRAKRFTGLAKRVEARYTAQLREQLGTAKTAILAGTKFASRTSNDTLRSSK